MMETYRITPRRHNYRVEAVAANGTHRLVDVWSTEEAAVSRLRSLQSSAEIAERRIGPTTQGWRG